MDDFTRGQVYPPGSDRRIDRTGEQPRRLFTGFSADYMTFTDLDDFGAAKAGLAATLLAWIQLKDATTTSGR